MGAFDDSFIDKRTEDIFGNSITGSEVILLYLSAVNRNAHKRYSKVWRVGISIHAALGNITVTASLKVNFYTIHIVTSL